VHDVDSRYVDYDQRTIPREGPPFDRVGFAMRALRVLRPEGLTVAVHPGRWELRVQRGRDWARGDGARWAIVSIPPDASREHIAIAVAELAGVATEPFMIETLIAVADPH
jgi:hypothetical protein